MFAGYWIDRQARAQAAWALYGLDHRSPELTQSLIEAKSHPDPEIVELTMYALAEIAKDEAAKGEK